VTPGRNYKIEVIKKTLSSDEESVEKNGEYSHTFPWVKGNIVCEIIYLLFAIQR
jgi:hypothetical protein